MNNITFRAPTKIYINDASEHGLGGFATHGRAWAWNIPKKLQGRAHINLLEFLSQLISIWERYTLSAFHTCLCLVSRRQKTTVNLTCGSSENLSHFFRFVLL